jgi:transcriptional regulator GlxA family with amidase domain
MTLSGPNPTSIIGAMKTVWVLMLDGALDSSLAITLDLLRTAQALGASSRTPVRFDWQVLGARRRVTTGSGLTRRTDFTFREALAGTGAPHWAIVPALGEYGPRLDAALARPDVQLAARLLCQLHENGRTRIAASCASTFLLADAGLLHGRSATTTWWLAGEFRRRHPAVTLDERRMVVRDGRLLTAGSAFSQLDLMLAVIGELAGVRVAELCARYLLIDRRPSQARYMMASHALHHDPLVSAAERWIDEHLGEPIGVQALAAALALGERTLARRVNAATGLSPLKLIQRRRLLMATHLIETTRTPIETVAERVGYADSTTLRRLLRRELGQSPSTLRAG